VHDRRREAEEDRQLRALATDAGIVRVAGRGDRRVPDGRLVGRLHVLQRHALGVCVREGHVRTGPGHEVGIARGGPAGDPAAVAVLLGEPVDHLGGLVRREQGVGRPRRAVGVPEAVVDVDLSVDDLRSGLGRRAGGRRLHRARVLVLRGGRGAGVLEGGVRVEVEPVEVGVERRQLVCRGPLDLDPLQDLVPGILRGVLDVVERARLRDLHGEVLLRLLHSDQ